MTNLQSSAIALPVPPFATDNGVVNDKLFAVTLLENVAAPPTNNPFAGAAVVVPTDKPLLLPNVIACVKVIPLFAVSEGAVIQICCPLYCQ
jgi:hypothetical protein